jgi:hypothetical protein
MYKGKNETSRELVKDRIYEFEEVDFESAAMTAQNIGTKMNWRLVLVAEINDRCCPPDKWTNL